MASRAPDRACGLAPGGPLSWAVAVTEHVPGSSNRTPRTPWSRPDCPQGLSVQGDDLEPHSAECWASPTRGPPPCCAPRGHAGFGPPAVMGRGQCPELARSCPVVRPGLGTFSLPGPLGMSNIILGPYNITDLNISLLCVLRLLRRGAVSWDCFLQPGAARGPDGPPLLGHLGPARPRVPPAGPRRCAESHFSVS